jgi:ABC-type transport system involved in multi-copper enzyme maturation permease subunit
MKYLAILKDCLQEALDSKVLYVMLAVSVLVIVIVGSVSYYPASVEHALDHAGIFSRSSSYGENAVSVQWRYDKVENLRASKDGVDVPEGRRNEPWLYDYSFDIVWRATVNVQGNVPPQEKADIIARSRQSMGAETIADDVKRNFQWRSTLNQLKDLKVTEQTSDDPQVIRVHVTSHGTRADNRVEWPHYLRILYLVPITEEFQMPLHFWLWLIEDYLLCGAGAGVALILSIIMTGFFVPNMLRKGTVDLLIVKPINRVTLLLYKYIGGLSYMFINTVVIVLGVWLVIGARSGVWGTGFLLSIPILTFQFAIFYAVSTLFGVLTRSTIVAILMGCGTWALVSLLGWVYIQIDKTRHMNEEREIQMKKFGQARDDEANNPDRQYEEEMLPRTVYNIADAIHFVLPRMKDLDVIITRGVQLDLLGADNTERKAIEKLYSSFRGWEAFAVSGLWIAAMLGLACWRFSTKDY